MSKPARFDAVSVLGPTAKVDIYFLPGHAHFLCKFLESDFGCIRANLRNATFNGYGKRGDCLFFSKATFEDDPLVLWNYICSCKMRPPELFFASFCKIMDTLKDNEWLVCRRKQPITYLTVPEKGFDIVRQRELERRLFIELVSVPAGRFGRLLPNGGVEYQRQLTRIVELLQQN